jgi:hypothetical protein
VSIAKLPDVWMVRYSHCSPGWLLRQPKRSLPAAAVVSRPFIDVNSKLYCALRSMQNGAISGHVAPPCIAIGA